MGPIDCPETSVRNYDLSLCNNAEERNSYVCCKFSLPDLLRPQCFKRIICDSLRCCKGLEFLYIRCGICGGQGATETGLSRIFFAVSYQHCFTNAAWSYFIHVSLTLCNL